MRHRTTYSVPIMLGVGVATFVLMSLGISVGFKALGLPNPPQTLPVMALGFVPTFVAAVATIVRRRNEALPR